MEKAERVTIMLKHGYTILYTVTCVWYYSMVVDTLMLLLQDRKQGKYYIVVSKNLKDIILEIKKEMFVDALCLHLFGLKKQYVERHMFYELSGYANVEVERTNSSDQKKDVTLSTQSTCVFIGLKSLAEVGSPSIGLLHKPPSCYGISLHETPVMYDSKLIFFQEDHLKIFLFHEPNQSKNFILPFQLIPTHQYHIRVITLTFLNVSADPDVIGFHGIKFSNLISFKAYHTIGESSLLYKAAIKHCSGRRLGIHRIEYLYRNKPKQYFDLIFNRDNGVMFPYNKDHNGDECSIINGNIDGLFFSTSLDLQTFSPPPHSYFGEIRLHVKALQLFRHECNLYFVDFYCHYHAHYVTVVLTPQFSQADEFCRQRLLLLNKYNNPFVYLRPTENQWSVWANHNVHVEVFFTEAIDISYLLKHNLGHFSKVIPLGRGSSKVEGIPKNKYCSICNLDPM